MSKHYEFPGGIDILPGKQGEAVTTGGLRLVSIGGALFTTTDGITFTVVGGGTVNVGSGLAGNGSVGSPLITAPTEYYATLGSAATSLLLSGLNGDTDGIYLVTIEMRSAAASNNLKIQVNGADTNLDCFSANTAVGGVAVAASWTLGQASQSPATFSSGDLWRGTLILCARSGRIRTMESCSVYVVKAGAVVAWSFAGRYNDTATNITSLGIVASQASGLGTGSFIHCVRIQTTNPLA